MTDLLFFVSSLGGGGAEMHLVRLINAMDRSRFRLSLAVARSGGSYESQLADDVRVYRLGGSRCRSATFRMVACVPALRALVRRTKPDVLCSVMDHANCVALTATRGLTAPPRVVVNVQIPPSMEYGNSINPARKMWLHLIRQLYPQADCVVAISHGIAHDLGRLSPRTRRRIEVIYNAGVDARVLSGAREPLTHLKPSDPLVVACGRLAPQKGFVHLINAVVQVRRHVPAHLWIIGTGAQRQELEEQIRRLGLVDSVRLLGFVDNPYRYFAAADMFVLSSIYEGFGNVIVEAMACGTAVVATECPHGPAEIIRNGVDGLLVPPGDVDALAHAIVRLLSDDTLRRQLAANGTVRARAFHADRIAACYGSLFGMVQKGVRYRCAKHPSGRSSNGT